MDRTWWPITRASYKLKKAKRRTKCHKRTGANSFGFSIAGAGAIVAACQKRTDLGPQTPNRNHPEDQKQIPSDEEGGEVTATEDLMREHGVLRRILLVHEEPAAKLRLSPRTIWPSLDLPTGAIQSAANLFREIRRRLPREAARGSIHFPRDQESRRPSRPICRYSARPARARQRNGTRSSGSGAIHSPLQNHNDWRAKPTPNLCLVWAGNRAALY